MKIVKGFFKMIGYLLLGLLGILLLKFLFHFTMFISFAIADISGFGGEKEWVYQYEFNIEAMSDQHTYVTSRYSGDSELRYYFIRKRNGALITGYTKASESSIVEDGQNKVKVYYEKPTKFKKVYDFMAEQAKIVGNSDDYYWKHYEYHIPKDSVKMDFSVDLE